MDELKHYGVLGMKWGKRRFYNDDGSLNSKGLKKDKKQADSIIKKRSTQVYIKSNNDAASKINGKWIDNFNKKWDKKFEGVEDWANSPQYSAYVKDYTNNLIKFMNESLKENPESKFETSYGRKYTAKFLEENGALVWAPIK